MDKSSSILSLAAQHPFVKAILDAAPRQWLPYAVAVAIGYPMLTRSLRYRRVKELHRKYPYKTRDDMAKMTDDDAFEIQKVVAQLEFPTIFVKALQFALFRVCQTYHHIPPIRAGREPLKSLCLHHSWPSIRRAGEYDFFSLLASWRWPAHRRMMRGMLVRMVRAEERDPMLTIGIADIRNSHNLPFAGPNQPVHQSCDIPQALYRHQHPRV